MPKRKLSIKGVENGEDIGRAVLKKLAKKATLLGKYATEPRIRRGSMVSMDSDMSSQAGDKISDNSSSNSDYGDSSSNESSSDDSKSSSESDSESEEESEDEVELEKRIKEKSAAKKKAEAAAQAAIDAWMNNADKSPSPSREKKDKSMNGQETSGSKAFKRVDTEVWNKEIINGLEDNTYEKVFGESGYGARASAKLLQVQGKKFQHEKTKAKRSSSYKGGAIDASAASRSFKYEDSD